MALGLLARKMGMTSIFTEEGVQIPVTVVKVEPNVVVAKRTMENDGYTALQLGTGAIREKLVNKPTKGHFAKANVEAKRDLKEFRVADDVLNAYEIGASIGIEFFKDAKSVDVSGQSKGKGYAGVMKRHLFGGFPRSHGTHETFRHGGSIGCRAQPGRVFKGKRMAGHMGDERVTTANLSIVRVMEEEGLLCLRGAVPGAKGGLLELRLSSRKPVAISGVGGVTLEEGSKNPMKASKAGAKSAPKKK